MTAPKSPAAAATATQNRAANIIFETAGPGGDLYKYFPDSIQLSQTALMLQDAFPYAHWLRPIIILAAVGWLVYRASQVLNKPLEELATLLGLDLPATPLIDLASIKADGAIVHWSLPEKQKSKSSLKYEIVLNGGLAETLSIHDTAATINGLRPDHYYVVRISLVHEKEFGSKSAAIRFRTKPAASGDFFHAPVLIPDADHDNLHDSVPTIRPFKGLKDVNPPPSVAEPMSREGSSIGVSSSRRNTIGGRKSSGGGVIDSVETRNAEIEQSETMSTLQQLAEKLESIQRETNEAEKMAREEEDEELQQKEELVRERDALRSEAVEREKASRNLKREVNTLERQNTAAQNDRTKHERLLQQKKEQRQKAKDDAVRWRVEAEEMRLDVERLQQEKLELAQKAQEDKVALQAKHAALLAEVKLLDDEVKEKTLEVRKLDRSIKNTSPAGDQEVELNLVQQLQHDAEEKRSWESHFTTLQHQYGGAVQKLEQAKRIHAEQVAYLENIRARRRQEDAAQYSSPPSTQERAPARAESPRARRAHSGHSSSDSPKPTPYALSGGPFSGNNASTSIFTPFMGRQPGMMINVPTDALDLPEDERDRLTGGALLSPSAGVDLIPTDLFVEQPRNQVAEPMPLIPGLGTIPGLPSILNPLSQPSNDQVPTSPVSSRAPSIFTSPQASQQNLHLGSPDNIIDADRQSIRSTRSGRALSGNGTGSRFSGMFGIKQRNRNVNNDDGLALGKTLSHSMPRQDQGIPGIDSNTRKRNSSISAMSGVNKLLNESLADTGSEAAPLNRRRGFNLFSKDKSDAWPSTFAAFGRRPTSPRPGSTHSTELPRPSFDSNRWGADAWSSVDNSSAARGSPLAFGTGWNAPSANQSRIFGSRMSSRRPSVQYNAGNTPDGILEDDDDDANMPTRKKEPQLAPIGTRPASSKKSGKQPAATIANASLDPNAKDFKSLFTGIKLRDKSSTSSSQPTTPNLSQIISEDSPPTSHKSRDNRDAPSIIGTESSIAGSRRTSSDLNLTSTYSLTDTPTTNTAPSPLLTGGSSFGKESFMAKLSRKSSSSKFSLPTFKRDKSRLDANAATTPTTPAPAEDEEDGMSVSVGSLREPRESREAVRGSGRNWGSVLKLGKKKGNETPSLSGVSLTSGATEEEGEEEDVR